MNTVTSKIFSLSPMARLMILTFVFLIYHVVDHIFFFDKTTEQWFKTNSLSPYLMPSSLEIVIVFASISMFYSAFYFLKFWKSRRSIKIADIAAALMNNEFFIEMQPKKNLKTGKIVGVESLVRWNHKKYGMVSPGDFIPIAETNEKIIKDLTTCVVEQTVKSYQKLKLRGFDIEMSVNISAANLSDPTVIPAISNAVLQHQMPMNQLVLEITETAIMEYPDVAIKILLNFDSLGAKISLDDFGTGHSSFLYLKHLPVREIKIDRSFIEDLSIDKRKRAIVKSTIQLAHDIGARVVAEGVTDKETEDLLIELDCDYAQGYYISKPLSEENLLDQLLNDKD